MDKKLRVGIIGAGSISDFHINAYLKNKSVEIKAISDLNEKLVSEKAKAAGIGKYYLDYNDLLADPEIDAVSIATPTFTHSEITIKALRAGKHVLCEKPPALNVAQAEENARVAKETGKLLMYGFVCRFMATTRFLKSYVDSGKMGKIIQAEAVRTERCSQLTGWFVDKNKAGGGALIDGAIHELDEALYLMGYPDPVSVTAIASNANSDLPTYSQGVAAIYTPADRTSIKRTVESLASGFITFADGSCIYVKSGGIMNCLKPERHLLLIGEKAGAKDIRETESLEMISLTDDGYFVESSPVLEIKDEYFDNEINHFTDCCLHGTDCICTPEQGVKLMRIICALYESASTGKPVLF